MSLIFRSAPWTVCIRVTLWTEAEAAMQTPHRLYQTIQDASQMPQKGNSISKRYQGFHFHFEKDTLTFYFNIEW